MAISNLLIPNNLNLFCSGFTANGNTDTTLNGKIIRFAFNAQTIGLSAATILSNYLVPNNSSISVEVFANGYITAGTSPGSSCAINPYLIRIKNVGGTISIGSLLLDSDSDPILNSASVTFTGGPSTLSIQVNSGVGTETLRWSGNIWIYY